MPYIVKKTLRKIVEKDNHYLVNVKWNQPKLKAALEETIILSKPMGYHKDETLQRGRMEIRETYLFARLDKLG